MITVNGRDYKEYFGAETLQYVVTQPLHLLNSVDKYDIKVNLDGGGVKGQAEALRLGITRALVIMDAENKPKLKANGFLTRDPMERADGTMGTLAAVAIILFHPLDILLHRPTIATFA
jgi:small subunit ribosomal protein S9